MILSLRQNRINIITGNTDATFSGDALRAAIEENRPHRGKPAKAVHRLDLLLSSDHGF